MKKEEQQTAPLLIYLTKFNLHPKTTLFQGDLYPEHGSSATNYLHQYLKYVGSSSWIRLAQS